MLLAIQQTSGVLFPSQFSHSNSSTRHRIVSTLSTSRGSLQGVVQLGLRYRLCKCRVLLEEIGEIQCSPIGSKHARLTHPVARKLWTQCDDRASGLHTIVYYRLTKLKLKLKLASAT